VLIYSGNSIFVTKIKCGIFNELSRSYDQITKRFVKHNFKAIFDDT